VRFLFKFLVICYCSSLTLYGCSLIPKAQSTSEVSITESAKSITVKISIPSTSVSGSGIVIKKSQNTYFAITNAHVIESALKGQLLLQTPDGKTYSANKVPYNFTKDDDLAVVEFTPPKELIYEIARIGASGNMKVGDRLYASGFANESEEAKVELKITTGKVLMLTKPLVGGYQIGYTNNVERGMSGGPLLNLNGEVIGINGIRKNPSLGDPYIFIDGSNISEELWQQMSELSWAIPIERINNLTLLSEKNLNSIAVNNTILPVTIKK